MWAETDETASSVRREFASIDPNRFSCYNASMKTVKSASALDQLVARLGDCLTPESARRLLKLRGDDLTRSMQVLDARSPGGVQQRVVLELQSQSADAIVRMLPGRRWFVRIRRAQVANQVCRQ